MAALPTQKNADKFLPLCLSSSYTIAMGLESTKTDKYSVIFMC